MADLRRAGGRLRRARRHPGVRFAYSLPKGPLGGQLLAAELETAPDEARMPLFELAGWA
ncbi:MAG: hypothetical protein QOI28_2197 [Mycobacterium sp.]|nr:hypothetical protein [Mycobacterium sp.]